MNEVVGMLDLDPVRRQGGIRKVLLVEGHDGVGIDLDGSRQDMAIVRVRERQRGDQRVIFSNKSVEDCRVHPRGGRAQPRLVKVAPVREKVSNPFVVDAFGPFGPKEPRRGQFDQYIPQRSRI